MNCVFVFQLQISQKRGLSILSPAVINETQSSDKDTQAYIYVTCLCPLKCNI